MACRTGLDPADCATDHWCPPLGGRAERAGWRAPCPACGLLRALSIQVKGRQLVWNTHCGCARSTVTQILRSAVPCAATARRARKPAADLAEVEALLSDRSLPASAIQVGGLRALGITTEDILRRLSMPRSTYYDAVRILGQKPRSASVRKLGQDSGSGSPNSRTKAQVTDLTNVA